jgi:hypothetical protein
VAIAGKLSDPDEAERVLASGNADMVAIARGLLADPAWANKVKSNQRDSIVQCDYCNVCKQLDGTHKPVICSLWPQGSLQAAKDEPSVSTPQWGSDHEVTVKCTDSSVTLRWRKVAGAARYDVYRARGDGVAQLVEATKLTNWTDNTVLGGSRYTYHVRASLADGRASEASPPVRVDLPRPAYMAGRP